MCWAAIQTVSKTKRKICICLFYNSHLLQFSPSGKLTSMHSWLWCALPTSMVKGFIFLDSEHCKTLLASHVETDVSAYRDCCIRPIAKSKIHDTIARPLLWRRILEAALFLESTTIMWIHNSCPFTEGMCICNDESACKTLRTIDYCTFPDRLVGKRLA